jgi:hypothetical protein
MKRVVELSTFTETKETERRADENPEARRPRFQRADRRRR